MKNKIHIVLTSITLMFILNLNVVTAATKNSAMNPSLNLIPQVNVSVNIGSQALWGPIGYDHVEYYYMPEYDVYYYVPTGQFIYYTNSWVFAPFLPSHYHVNFYNTYKVVLNDHKPYMHHNKYKTKYAKYKHAGHKQNSIRDSKDSKYYVVKGHPKHSNNKSSNNKSNYNKPSNNKPNYNKPSNNKPNYNKSSNNKPSYNKPSNNKPSNNKPSNNKPSNNKPSNNKQPSGNGGGGKKH